jgi:hypothetical protein
MACGLKKKLEKWFEGHEKLQLQCTTTAHAQKTKKIRVTVTDVTFLNDIAFQEYI